MFKRMKNNHNPTTIKISPGETRDILYTAMRYRELKERGEKKFPKGVFTEIGLVLYEARIMIKTISDPNGGLVVNIDDPPDFRYILDCVTANGTEHTHLGWKNVADAKQHRFWREADPKQGIETGHYLVPQSELEPMKTAPWPERSKLAAACALVAQSSRAVDLQN